MSRKTFKIGEYAKGGTLVAIINEEDITIQCRDYSSNNLLSEETTDDEGYLNMMLNDLTSCYYADKIIEWILTDKVGRLILRGREE